MFENRLLMRHLLFLLFQPIDGTIEYFFLNLVIGARTGPKIFTSFISGSFDLMFIANFIIKDSFFPDIIKDISR